MQIETDDERFRRVAAIFKAAAFLDTLGIRLEQSVRIGARRRSRSRRRTSSNTGTC
jgi:hypothetical protein